MQTKSSICTGPESALEPDLPIVDSHHHMWIVPPAAGLVPYDPEAVLRDKIDSGHNIVATVYVDARSQYRTYGPDAFRVVGETEFVDGVAEEGVRRGGRAAGVCAAIIAHADLALGAAVGEVLDAHVAASGRFRGIRFMTAYDSELALHAMAEPGVAARADFRDGFKELVKRGLSFDAWLLQTQLSEVMGLASAYPDANIILDHLGGPLGIGRFATKRSESFFEWRRDMKSLANYDNVTVKIGGMNMGLSGLAPNENMLTGTSENLARLQRDHVLTAIDLFGPARCMFESNAPVDTHTISYGVTWNSFKRITADFSQKDRAQLFAGTAIRAYRLNDVSCS
jgi:L-fuconolactonase